ncbi:imidazole glycerol phosphate synthase cyclase subunit [Sphingobacterium sp. InxBP1]|uniref:HisA/HisF-related TIM barrel protein n=1 Tax=Sphingobacterium sp. InxBP1 TaxID=2870328 RepID=UPI002243C5EB|nr:HisA/HisF-related TIM barrel protein [Sphingobacterium sp. InxBP1]MCW8310898.1 imidazole glycerol phosphate synthase cyclase subunit [Sphingobacterium sp. InxBP1]
MLRKRIIFTLLYNDGYFMQSRNFRLQKVGNINWLERNYKFKEIAWSLDEIIVLDTTKQNKDIRKFASTVEKIVEGTFIPVAAGGGVHSLKDAELLFNSGADKIVVNSALFENPSFVKELVAHYGSQSVVASIDHKVVGGNVELYIGNGTKKIDLNFEDYLKHLAELEIGEIYLNSIDRDGTGFGYDFSLIQLTREYSQVPIIIAGGAGNENHLLEALQKEEISAVATANLFNFIGDGLPNARKHIINFGENIANWDVNK